MLPITLKDAQTKKSVGVTSDSRVLVTIAESVDETPVQAQCVYFQQYFDSVGDGTGTTTMLVNGGTTPQIFKIKAQEFHSIIITQITIVLIATQTLEKFGALAALANGVKLGILQNNKITYVIPAAKTGMDLIVFGDNYTFLTNIYGTADVLTINYDLSTSFLGDTSKLISGHPNEIFIQINDNLTTVGAAFFAVGKGYLKLSKEIYTPW